MGTPFTKTTWVDWNAANNSVGDDLETLRELAAMFRDAMTRHLALVQEAFSNDDWERLAHESHAMKGQIGFFTQAEPFQAARQTVSTARAGTEEVCRESCERLGILVKQLITEIEEGLDDRENPHR